MREFKPLRPVARRPRPVRLPRDTLLPILAILPLIATGLAFFADAHGKSTMLLLSILSFGAISIAFIRLYLGLGRRNQMPLLIMYTGLIFWYYYPCLAVALSEDQWHKAAALIRIDNDHALTTLLLVNLFTFLIAVTNQVRFTPRLAERLRRFMGPRPAPPTGRTTMVVLIALAACIGFYIVAAGGPVRAFELMLASRAEKKPWDREGYEGSSLAMVDVVVEAILVAFIALGIHLALDSEMSVKRKLILVVAALLALAWIGIQRGTRSILIEVAAPPLGIYYARVAGKLSQARVRRTIVLLGLFVAMILAANFQRQYRRTTVVEDIKVQVTDSDFFGQCVYAVAVQEKEGRFFHDSVLLHILSGPVPRFLWQDKPRMDGMWVFTEYLWGKDTSQVGGNTQPSVVGEYYTNWGWWGVLEVGLVLGLIVRLLDITFGAAGPRDMARFGVLGVMAYFFCSFRFLSFAFFPVAVMTVAVGMVMARFRWFTGTSRPSG